MVGIVLYHVQTDNRQVRTPRRTGRETERDVYTESEIYRQREGQRARQVIVRRLSGSVDVLLTLVQEERTFLGFESG